MDFKKDILPKAVALGFAAVTCVGLTGVGTCAVSHESKKMEKNYFLGIQDDAASICYDKKCDIESTEHIEMTVDSAKSKLRTAKKLNGGFVLKNERDSIKEEALKEHSDLHDENLMGE